MEETAQYFEEQFFICHTSKLWNLSKSLVPSIQTPSLGPPDAVHVAVPAVGGVCWGGEALQLGGQNRVPQLVEAQPGLLSTLLQLITKSPHLAKFQIVAAENPISSLAKISQTFLAGCISLVIT